MPRVFFFPGDGDGDAGPGVGWRGSQRLLCSINGTVSRPNQIIRKGPRRLLPTAQLSSFSGSSHSVTADSFPPASVGRIIRDLQPTADSICCAFRIVGPRLVRHRFGFGWLSYKRSLGDSRHYICFRGGSSFYRVAADYSFHWFQSHDERILRLSIDLSVWWKRNQNSGWKFCQLVLYCVRLFSIKGYEDFVERTLEKESMKFIFVLMKKINIWR